MLHLVRCQPEGSQSQGSWHLGKWVLVCLEGGRRRLSGQAVDSDVDF